VDPDNRSRFYQRRGNILATAAIAGVVTTGRRTVRCMTAVAMSPDILYMA